MILIEVHASRISIAVRTVHTAAARRFVEWLRTQYEVRFLDETFTDVTAEANDLSCLFG